MFRNRVALATCTLLFLGGLEASRADELMLGCNHCAMGSGSYAGGASPLTYGLGPLEGMTWGSGSFSSAYSIYPGSVSLETGPFSGSSAAGWSFGSGGSFTLTGRIVTGMSSGTITEVLSNRTLLTGSILSASVLIGMLPDVTVRADIQVTADADALALLGLPETEYVGSFRATAALPYPLGLLPEPPDSFDVVQTHEAFIRLDSVPEPSAWLLLATIVAVIARTAGTLRTRRSRPTGV